MISKRADHSEKKWYNYLKRKYKLSDDDMEEYIESFDSINKGEDITPEALKEFINCELNDQWSKYECDQILQSINREISRGAISSAIKTKNYIDIYAYLSYIIPICHEYVVTRIGIREIFDSLDKNGDGKITCCELISLLYNVNQHLNPDEISEYTARIKKICKIVDENGDGYISYDEFKKFMINIGLTNFPHKINEQFPKISLANDNNNTKKIKHLSFPRSSKTVPTFFDHIEK